MNSGARVLVVSRDQMLLQTRQLILGAYFQVEGAGRIQEAEALIARYRFDLIVLCASLSDNECQRVADVVADLNPRPKILTLSSGGGSLMHPESDQTLVTEAGPYHLLKKSAELLGVDLKNKGQALRV
jgi:DNA-binding response OmpR family regulator